MILTFSLLLVLLLNSCDQGVEPVPKCNAAILDTTSHAFTWTIVELGDGGGNILYDVAIINDTLIYAVGELYQRGSTGEVDPIPYSVAKWDGKTWKFLRLYYAARDYYGHEYTAPLMSVKGILAFTANDVWLAPGSVFHWNGADSITSFSFNRLTLQDPNATVLRLSGTSSNDLFGAGGAGTIVRYNNGTWQKLASGTTLPIRDIWGATDPVTGKQTILAVASGSFPEEGKKLLSIDGNTVTSLADEGLSWSLSGIWFVPNCRYYIVGAGIHQKSTLKDPVWTVYPPGDVTSYGSSAVYGQNLNDVFVVGSFLEIVHFNGSTWYNYRKEIPLTDGVIADVDIKGDLVILVGYFNQRALIITGRR